MIITGYNFFYRYKRYMEYRLNLTVTKSFIFQFAMIKKYYESHTIYVLNFLKRGCLFAVDEPGAFLYS